MPHLAKLTASIALVLLCATAFPQPATPPGQSSSSPATSPELAVAKAELEVTRRLQEQLLSTVLWSLGTLAAIATLLVGYSWWNNSRNYERDRAILERELKALLADAVAKAAEEQRTAMQSRIELLETKLQDQLGAAEARLLNAAREAAEESKKESSTQITQLKSSVASIRTGVRKLQLSSELEERNSARSAKFYRNALQNSVSALELAVKMNDDYEIGNVLDLVSADVTTILEGNDLPIDNFLIGQLVEVLDSVKGSHAHAAAALKSKAPRMLGK